MNLKCLVGALERAKNYKDRPINDIDLRLLN